MKIAFSTLGCPEWTWKEILITAKDLGYDGIEIRGIGKEIYVPTARPFWPKMIERSKNELADRKLEIPCLTSSCYLHKQDVKLALKEGKEYIDLAQKLDTPFIRVLGDQEPYPQGSVNEQQVAELLGILGDYAEERGVIVLIETNGAFADSHKMLRLMNTVNHPYVAVLWDVHHPYRFMNETVDETFSRLKQYIKHVHIKDSEKLSDGIRYCLIGQGDVPLKRACQLLKEHDYDGYLSLEWLKRWYYDLEAPDIVFSHFIHAIKKLLQ